MTQSRQSALGDAPALAGPALSVAPRAPFPLWHLAGWPGSLDALRDRFAAAGLALPERPGVAQGEDGQAALALAPGRWLIEGAVPTALDPELGALTDLGHARVSFLIEGADAPALAAKLAPVDFDLPRHGPGSVVQSGSAHSVPFALWRQAPARFVLYVDRSYGRDFHHSLAAEGAESGLGPA